jgi:hypothetical protein
MALGLALAMNIRLPQNFNSPYKARSIQDFWRRWHMTLSRFLRDYIYIPLGGNRRGIKIEYFAIFATFLIGGVWHGAGWTFILWGAAHGAGMVMERTPFVSGLLKKIPIFIRIALTFSFVNATWVLFRAESLPAAFRVFQGMFDFRSLLTVDVYGVPVQAISWLGSKLDWLLSAPTGLVVNLPVILLLIVCFVISFNFNNSNQILEGKVSPTLLIYLSLFAIIGLIWTNSVAQQLFLYFNF